MKTLLRIAATFALITASTTTIYAQSEYRRTIEKSCPATVKAINIEHSYSSVTITEWDKAEIYMSAEIVTKGKTSEQAKEISDWIDVKFLPNLDKGTKIKTEINHDKINKISKNSNEYKISISIKAPRYLAAVINMSFGNTTINVPLKSLNLEGSYGNLKVAEIDETAHVAVKFGNIEIDKVGGALNASTKYGNLTVGKCPILNASADFGNAKIGTVDQLYGSVSYGSISVASAKQINMSEIAFSKCTIENFQTDLNISSLRYGSVNASTSENFKSISIKSEFSPVKIAISGTPSYTCTLNNQFGDITTVFPVTSTTTTTSSKKNGSQFDSSITGTVGSGGSKSIKITNRYSSIAIVKK